MMSMFYWQCSIESSTDQRGANLKLNLKPTGIQAIAKSKLKLKRPAEDERPDAEREKESSFMISFLLTFYEC